MSILLLSTTGHPEANLESARYFLENKSDIEKITILSTDFMMQSGKTELLMQSLKEIFNKEIQILDLPSGHEEHDMFGIENLLIEWAQSQPAKARFIFNVTGGTKLMSIALDRTAMLLGPSRAECFYQSRDQHLVWYQRKNNKTIYSMNSNLNLQQRIFARGYQITKQQPLTEIAIEQLRYAEIMIDIMKNDFHKGRRFCSFINKLAAISDDKEMLSLFYPQMQQEEAEGLAILADITQQAFFSFDKIENKITFNDENSRDFMKGGWLEVYAGYECYKALIHLAPTAELAINVELKKKDTPNEMDVMFIHHAYLYCIECKTAKTMASETAKDVLYKLSALQDFGGINQKRAVVSLYNLKDYNLTRAENADIKIFQEKELLNLSEHILQWIQSTHTEKKPVISL